MEKLMKTILKSIIFFATWLVLSVLIPIPDSLDDAKWRFVAELISFVSIIIITYIFYRIEDRNIIVFPYKSSFKEYIVAILIGFLWFFLPYCLLKTFGYLEITSKNSINVLTLWIFSAFINTIMQELLARGYIYQLIKREYNLWAASIVTTLIFTFMHGGAFEAGPIAVINVITMSLLMTIILEYSNSLVIPIIMHFIWNCFGGIIFGTVSLADDYPHLYNIKITGNQLISGGSFKMEGSIFVFIINIIMIFIVYYLYRRKKSVYK
jgi:CAAX amino terminal protease family protein